MRDPYAEGWQAFGDGIAKLCCPYVDDQGKRDWIAGWVDAQTAFKQAFRDAFA